MPPDPEPPPDPQHVTVTRRDNVDFPTDLPNQYSAGSHGCLGTLAIWTLAWLAVAYLAISRAWQSPDFSALVGAIVSGTVAFIGCRFIQRLLRTDSPLTLVNISGYVTIPRQFTGWIAALLAAGVAVALNCGVFVLLIKSAKAGFGWSILILVFFSLVALFLLFVLLTGIGVTIDRLRSRK